ncbi:MAG: TRAP transporter small permease subunit [Burkholderiaceae bacterium]|jgi:TRAP-type C4-dicarboxylate transport system permease small subunit|nr:TRAP transporter small permease subunit [Burkholderiaceae bacterium]
MSMLAVCERLGRRVANAIAIVGLLALMFLAALTLADGLLRSFFNYPLEGVRDAGALAIAIGVSCCFPIALLERSNITVRFIAHLFGVRASRFCDLLAALLTGLIFFGMAYKLSSYALEQARTNDMTWILHIPTAPFWFGVAVVMWLSVVMQCIMIVTAAHQVIRPPPIELKEIE